MTQTSNLNPEAMEFVPFSSSSQTYQPLSQDPEPERFTDPETGDNFFHATLPDLGEILVYEDTPKWVVEEARLVRRDDIQCIDQLLEGYVIGVISAEGIIYYYAPASR